MTTNPFRITPTPPTSIRVEPDQEGRFSFTVESLAAPGRTHEIILQALRIGEGGKGEEVDWLVAGPPGTLSITGGETRTVTITARAKPTRPRGESKLKLVIADKDQPNDVFADSPTVALEALGPAAATSPPKKFPWWLIAIIAGGVLLVAGAGLLIWKLAGGRPGREPGGLPGVGEPCGGEPGKECAAGLVCDAGSRTCRRPPPGCTPDAKRCTADRGSIETCEDNRWTAAPCPASTTCDPTTRTCKGLCADGPTNAPWPGWDTVYTTQAGDAITTFGPAANTRLTGSPASNNSANVEGTELIVGDEQFLGGTTTNDLISQGAITFDLPGLPQTAKIVSATLQLFQTRTEGLAYQAPLSQVVVEHVRFPDAWGADESTPIAETLGANRTVLSADRSIGPKIVEVTPALRYELATCRTRLQLRLKFVPELRIPNALEDSARFASDDATENRPALNIRWRN